MITVRAALIFFSLAFFAAGARAQESGGSFGGGSFGGGGGGGHSYSGGGGGGYSGGGSSYSGSRGSSYSSGSGDSYSSSSSGGSKPLDAVALLFIVVLFIVVLALVGAFNAYAKSANSPMSTERGADSDEEIWGGIDVSSVSLGIDWRARRVVQERLADLAKGGTKSNDELVELLRKTVELLKEVRIAWLYASVQNHSQGAPGEAESRFKSITSDLRSRFKRESVRNVDGAIANTDVGNITAKAYEGEGTVVVTIVLGAKVELRDVHTPNDATEIDGLLNQMSNMFTGKFAAMEVIWSPSVENDRMSSAELEQFYPELRKLDESSIAGRVFCEFCRGPFAMELLKCPHCGAPVAAKS